VKSRRNSNKSTLTQLLFFIIGYSVKVLEKQAIEGNLTLIDLGEYHTHSANAKMQGVINVTSAWFGWPHPKLSNCR